MTVELFLGRLKAAAAAMAECEGETKAFIAETQKAALARMAEEALRACVGGTKLAQATAVMTNGLAASGLPQDITSVIFDIIGKTAVTLKDVKRWHMQDFRALFQYFTAEEWKQFGALKDWANINGAHQQEHMWFSRAAALGCLHPSEHTVKTWSVFLFLARNGGTLGSLAEHHELALRQENGRVRSTFNRIKVMHPAAFKDQDIHTLPTKPDDLEVINPEAFKSVFPTCRPVDCPFRLDMVEQGLRFWKCRGFNMLNPRSRPVHALLGMEQLALTNDGTPTSIVFPTCDTKDSQLRESNDAVNRMTRTTCKSNDSLSSDATVAAATEASTPQMTSSRGILAALLDRHHQAAGDDGDDGDDGDNGEDGALGDPPMDCNVLSAMQSRAAQKLPMKKPAKFVVLKKPSHMGDASRDPRKKPIGAAHTASAMERARLEAERHQDCDENMKDMLAMLESTAEALGEHYEVDTKDGAWTEIVHEESPRRSRSRSPRPRLTHAKVEPADEQHQQAELARHDARREHTEDEDEADEETD